MKLCISIVVGCTLLFLLLASRSCDAQNITLDNWMRDLKDYIYQYSLLEVTLPGTHDSGMYYYENAVGPMESDTLHELIRVANEFTIPIYPFIGNWALAQDTTFYDQLMGGVRYLDLRACIYNNTWYTEHFLIGVPTQVLLNDIKKFVSTHPGEVIIVEVGDLSGSSHENVTVLLNMITKSFQPYLAKPSASGFKGLTIGQMVSARQQIVVLFPSATGFPDYSSFLWDLSAFKEGSYADKDVLSEMVAWNVDKINTEGGHGKLFELSWTLTTQVPQIAKSVDPYFHPRTLKELALIADNALGSFVAQYKNYKLGNMILVDFWNDSQVVALAIYLNMRMCNDNADFIAVTDNGQYCRQYYTNGNCTNIKYIPWMRVNCPLSCGYC